MQAIPDAVAASAPWQRDNPYPARLAALTRLTSPGSIKDVRHVEIDLGDSGITYVPGDTLGLWVTNDPGLVDEVLRACGLRGDERVVLDERELPLRQALGSAMELTQVHPGFIKQYAALNAAPNLAALAGNPAELRRFLENRQIIEVLLQYPAQLEAQALLSCLRHMNPRQYSIASSPLCNPRQVDLTVGLVRYQSASGQRQGAGSGFIGERSAPGDTLLVYPHANPNFRLPEDPDVPIVMIGPGTGIAPFRAFLQERELTGARGRNWLYFGNPQRAHDFLYEDELRTWERRGHLQQLRLAFSRDQAAKVYVQDLLLADSGPLFALLEEGAHVYVCGDAKRMAEGVQHALLQLIATAGGMAPTAARQYLVDMRQNKRYQRDVY
ncbi:MAG TPA: hypothetical protein VNR18_05760 [Hyphomicrobiales bacterium]|nr:hypothetical protein [Hyphomicrobiales bacterium]